MGFKATLAPGQNGITQLLKQDGAQLICVCYPFDKTRLKRLKIIKIKYIQTPMCLRLCRVWKGPRQ